MWRFLLTLETEVPKWDDIDLSLIGIPNMKYLENQHIVLEVLTSDYFPLGQAVVSLKVDLLHSLFHS